VYGSAITLGAFLLFLVQPMAAKMLLAWFGGTAGVWTVALLFFQVVLLGGYLYAAWLDRKVSRALHARIHLSLVAASLVAIAVAASLDWTPRDAAHPELDILSILTGTIGLPFIVLSTTGPLLQSWFRDSGLATPYRFYAVSNAGSLLALFLYPVVVEPWLSRQGQIAAWLAGYAIYVILIASVTRGRTTGRSAGPSEAADTTESPGTAPTRPADDLAFWIALGACGSLLVAGVTSHLTQNLTPVPFLWVVPLALYLLSFIVCFSHERAYWRPLWVAAAGAAVVGLSDVLQTAEPPRLGISLGLFLAGLFACCMFVNGELARSKPDATRLTTFYAASAFGGVCGTTFAAVVAPHVFAGYYELLVGLIFCGVLACVVLYREAPRLAGGFLWAIASAALVSWVATEAVIGIRRVGAESTYRARNFYGALRVEEEVSPYGHPYRKLVHGTIVHGLQVIDPQFRCEPTTYYGRAAGLDEVLGPIDRQTPLHVGAIGLGAGTIAAYARPGDRFRFYEINPLVAGLATSQFTFLRACAKDATTIVGDARLMLEREPGQAFDALIMDAFSGDAVPIHLLTKEAFDVYFRHLNATGVIAVHITNRYVDLKPVLRHIARHYGKDLRIIDSRFAQDVWLSSVWALIAAPGVLPPHVGTPDSGAPTATHDVLWTDDFSSMWGLLRW
jgi:hypothetical protein